MSGIKRRRGPARLRVIDGEALRRMPWGDVPRTGAPMARRRMPSAWALTWARGGWLALGVTVGLGIGLWVGSLWG